jgi:DNA-binding transcriptional LysR family regulator
LCQGFIQAHPGVQIEQIEDHADGLLDRLRTAQIDVAITYDLQLSDYEPFFEPVATLRPHVIVAESDRLMNRGTVELEALARRLMVLLDLPLSHEYFLSLFHAVALKPTTIVLSP